MLWSFSKLFGIRQQTLVNDCLMEISKILFIHEEKSSTCGHCAGMKPV